MRKRPSTNTVWHFDRHQHYDKIGPVNFDQMDQSELQMGQSELRSMASLNLDEMDQSEVQSWPAELDQWPVSSINTPDRSRSHPLSQNHRLRFR